jgi:hypothetical protein
MMREAQKMMADPNFQANMEKMMKGGGVQQAMQQTERDMKDPTKLKAMEEKAEKAISDGNKELEDLENLKAAKQAAAPGEKGDANTAAAAAAPGEEDQKKAAIDDETKEAGKTNAADEVPDIPSLNIF